MTTNTEALRRAFEGYINPDADIDVHWQAAGYYAGRNLQMSWLDFQAGHAAAKAETAAVGARGISLARELRDQADFDEAESVFGGGSRTRELMREAADALHAGAEERGE